MAFYIIYPSAGLLLGTAINTPFFIFNISFLNNNLAIYSVEFRLDGDLIPDDCEKNAGKY
jgi:hypothetical protein